MVIKQLSSRAPREACSGVVASVRSVRKAAKHTVGPIPVAMGGRVIQTPLIILLSMVLLDLNGRPLDHAQSSNVACSHGRWSHSDAAYCTLIVIRHTEYTKRHLNDPTGYG